MSLLEMYELRWWLLYYTILEGRLDLDYSSFDIILVLLLVSWTLALNTSLILNHWLAKQMREITFHILTWSSSFLSFISFFLKFRVWRWASSFFPLFLLLFVSSYSLWRIFYFFCVYCNLVSWFFIYSRVPRFFCGNPLSLCSEKKPINQWHFWIIGYWEPLWPG